MDSSIIAKLLAHYFCNDGRTLVRLSGVNRLWRTLLRREPDGALFVFCRNAFVRLPYDATFINRNYIETFMFYAQMQLYGENTALMLKTLILYSIEYNRLRLFVSHTLQLVTPKHLGNLAMTVECEEDCYPRIFRIEIATWVIQRHFYKWLWNAHLERGIWWRKITQRNILVKEK